MIQLNETITSPTLYTLLSATIQMMVTLPKVQLNIFHYSIQSQSSIISIMAHSIFFST